MQLGPAAERREADLRVELLGPVVVVGDDEHQAGAARGRDARALGHDRAPEAGAAGRGRA